MGNLKINEWSIDSKWTYNWYFIIDYYPKSQEEKNIANDNLWKLYKKWKIGTGWKMYNF